MCPFGHCPPAPVHSAQGSPCQKTHPEPCCDPSSQDCPCKVPLTPTAGVTHQPAANSDQGAARRALSTTWCSSKDFKYPSVLVNRILSLDKVTHIKLLLFIVNSFNNQLLIKFHCPTRSKANPFLRHWKCSQ